MNCPHCGAEAPPNARFCMNCGQPVKVDSGGAVPTQRGRLPLSGERKFLTALFADVVGSTSLAEQMDPEDWTAIMNRAFERLSLPIERYEGRIVRLLGDALLALFGAPTVHEDDPARAVHAALEMIEATRALTAEIEQEHGISFAIRIGINTGPVVVGAIGSELHSEYTAMGDAVNLAARMQTTARPMTVLISEHTYHFVAPLVDTIDLGPIEVKGKSEPVRVYEVRGARAEPGHLRGLSGLESPMVGRESELRLLSELAAQVRHGKGHAILVVGEAGLGKSRLINEWKTSVASDKEEPALWWAEGQCLSYGAGLAYHLVLDLLRSLLDVPAGASEPETRAALQTRVEDLFDAHALDIYPYLAHLLSLQLSGEAQDRVQQLDPQALHRRYLTVLRQFLRATAERRPLVVILEDIHWADPSSADMFAQLLPLALEAPLLFCLVCRPDQDAPGWKLVIAAREILGDHLTEIYVNALSEEESRTLVSNLLEIEALPESIRSTILKKAEGNPFFVEEVIRVLIDRGALSQADGRWVAQEPIDSLDIPDSLQGLLLARIDRLPEEVKHTLRVAAVIGRQFPVTVLEQVLNSAPGQ